MNLFLIALATVAHHLDDWGIQTLEANHEKHFDDRDCFSSRFVRSCLHRSAGNGKGGAYRASGALLHDI
jgi:hypothetical protein